MTSDLQPSAGEQEPSAPKRAPKEILQSEIHEGLEVLHRSTGGLFMSGLSAGLDLGFSVLLMAVMWTQTHGRLPEPVVHILIANMYAVGFVFVVLGRSELFTEQTTLAVLPVLNRNASLASLLRLWIVVYVANLIGGAIFAKLVTVAGPALGDIAPAAFGHIAHEAVDHGSNAIFISAVLAGWLMGLLSWLVAAGRDTISQIVIVWLVAASIGFAGLHHAVAGSIEILAGVFAHQGVSLPDAVRVISFTTLGNIVGGVVFVAVIKYGHAKPTAGEEDLT
ncbi:MAG TPA: formate/nitrite transporter family protein [Tepidisphaeraceae bacterium]|nr:formate/nitrite transporter family protein [Tepidisphaeraceae bacterium]